MKKYIGIALAVLMVLGLSRMAVAGVKPPQDIKAEVPPDPGETKNIFPPGHDPERGVPPANPKGNPPVSLPNVIPFPGD